MYCVPEIPPKFPEGSMTTLTASPLADVLARLFAESDASETALREARGKRSPEERQRMSAQQGDYREFYLQMKDYHLAVSRETATLIYMMARSIGARSIVEYGTSFGLSTLHLAAALRDNGGGRLIGSEFAPTKVAQARRNIAEAGVSDLVEIRDGDALETLARDLPETIDFVLMDGAKNLYPAILSLIEPRLRPGALIVADNADRSPDYLARVCAPDGGFLSVPFAEDVELSMRTGGAKGP